MRAQAEIYYSNNNNTYGISPFGGSGNQGRCTDTNVYTAQMFLDSSNTDGLLKLVQSIATQVNDTQSLSYNAIGYESAEAACYTSPLDQSGGTKVTAWAMAVKGATPGNFYCVDSSGVLKSYNSTLISPAT